MLTLLILDLFNKSLSLNGWIHDATIAIAVQAGTMGQYSCNDAIREMVRMRDEGLFTVDADGFVHLSQKGRESMAMATFYLDLTTGPVGLN